MAGVLSTQEESGCPETAKGYGPTDIQREMLSMTGRHAPQRERPGLKLGVLLMGIYIPSQVRLFLKSTLRNPGGTWLKIHALKGWVKLVTGLLPSYGS